MGKSPAIIYALPDAGMKMRQSTKSYSSGSIAALKEEFQQTFASNALLTSLRLNQKRTGFATTASN